MSREECLRTAKKEVDLEIGNRSIGHQRKSRSRPLPPDEEREPKEKSDRVMEPSEPVGRN